MKVGVKNVFPLTDRLGTQSLLHQNGSPTKMAKYYVLSAEDAAADSSVMYMQIPPTRKPAELSLLLSPLVCKKIQFICKWRVWII